RRTGTWSGVPVAGAPPQARHDPAPGRAALPLLAALSGAAVRRDGPRPGAGMSEPLPPRTTSAPVEVTPELARKNILLGWMLLGIALLIAAGAVAVSLIYLQFD